MDVELVVPGAAGPARERGDSALPDRESWPLIPAQRETPTVETLAEETGNYLTHPADIEEDDDE